MFLENLSIHLETLVPFPFLYILFITRCSICHLYTFLHRLILTPHVGQSVKMAIFFNKSRIKQMEIGLL